MRVLVINRDVDRARMAQCGASAAAFGIVLDRVPALDAHDPGFPFARYAGLIGAHFWGEASIKPGAIGCFLSHRRAWQTLLDSDERHALICEDDAAFVKGLKPLQRAAGELGDFDLLFGNGRLAAWCGAVAESHPHRPLAEVVALLGGKGGPRALGLKPSPGADCYLLTRRGAARLLALTAEQRIVCGVDWSMVWSALGPRMPEGAAAAFPELAILSRHLTPADPPLSAHVLSEPVADQARGPSVLRHAVTRPIAELVAGSSGSGRN